jgi:UDP-2-acetamido-3-amino-2,3-dideoxy-glucuronate N-acetyltransferase
MTFRVADSADLADTAVVGDGTAIWDLAQIREGAILGEECVVGRGAYIGPGVRVGDRCKIQNHALIYEPTTLDEGVFVGPAVVFTNDHYPRAVNPEGTLKKSSDWEPVGVQCRRGSSIGARAVCVAPLTVGRWAMVAAGSVVIRDVPDFALVAGVPARRLAWVGRAGVPLQPGQEQDVWVCPLTGSRYRQTDEVLTEQ